MIIRDFRCRLECAGSSKTDLDDEENEGAAAEEDEDDEEEDDEEDDAPPEWFSPTTALGA